MEKTDNGLERAWQAYLKRHPLGSSMHCAVYVRSLQSDQKELSWQGRRMPSASLIKVPVMAEAFRQEKEGLISLRDHIKVYDAVEGGSFYYLPAHTEVTVADLVQHMIVESDNTCANMLIDLLGMEHINEEIQHLGLTETVLQRKMMDFAAAAAGKENMTTPADMGRLFQLLHDGACIDEQRDAAMLDILRWQEDNCVIPAQLPGPVPVAHKTGELDHIYHDCGIVYAPFGAFILCLMANHIDDEAQAIYDMSYLARAIYDIMKNSSL